MAIDEIEQTISEIPALRLRATVNRTLQSDKDDFVNKYEANNNHLVNNLVPELNTLKTEINTTTQQINVTAEEIGNNADLAQSITNYQGVWTSKGYSLKQTVSVSGVYYVCKLTHTTGQNPTTANSIYWELVLGNWNLKINKNLNPEIGKTTPVDADLLPLSDSESDFSLRKLSWANIKATLKTYFDTLYLNLFAINKGVIDANTLSSGRNYVASTSTNIPIASAGFIDCIAISGGNIVQVFTTVSAGESATAIQYVRTGNYVTNTWTAWTRQYSQRNIIGTVSQSAGVPSGAIIEQGSNVNGEWTKYADGTIEGSCTITTDLTASSTSGSVFITTANIPIPTTLASISDVQLTGQRVSGGVFWASLSSAYSTTNIPCYGIASTTGTVGKIKANFRGRWY